MTVTRAAFTGNVEERQIDDASTGKQGAFPAGPGLPGDKTTGAGKGKRALKKYGGKVAGVPPGLTEGGGGLGKTGGGP